MKKKGPKEEFYRLKYYIQKGWAWNGDDPNKVISDFCEQKAEEIQTDLETQFSEYSEFYEEFWKESYYIGFTGLERHREVDSFPVIMAKLKISVMKSLGIQHTDEIRRKHSSFLTV